MKVGIFLAIGESFEDFISKGQADLLVRQNIGGYSKAFDHVYVFSYGILTVSVPSNVTILPNRYGLHRYLYCFLMPLLYKKEITSCQVLRGLQLSGGIPGVIANLLFGKKFVINYGYRYSHVAAKEGKSLQSVFYTLIEPIILHFSSAVIVTTKRISNYINKKNKNSVLIPNGIDINIFKPDSQKKPSDQILFVGRLEAIKNLENLILAVSGLKKRYRLKMIGTGSLKEKLLKLALNNNVKLEILDGVKNQDIARHLNASTVFILPSYEEGHPKALLEAMACGLPVIGTNVEGTKETITNGVNGLLCGTSVNEINKALEILMGNHLLQKKLGTNARSYIAENFSHEPLMQKEIKLMKTISH